MAQKEAADQNFKNMLVTSAKYVVGTMIGKTPEMLDSFVASVKKHTPMFSKSQWTSWCNDLVNKKIIDPNTANTLKTLTEYDQPWAFVLTLMATVKVKMADLDAVLNIYSLDKQYDLMGNATPHPAPVDNLVRAMIIDPGRATENRAEMKKHGYNDMQIDNIILSYYRTTDENTLRTQYLRGIINESRLYERMRELGYTDQRTSEIVQTWTLLPSPQDLFTMVAKEAFEPDMYRTLGLDAEFPTEQVEWLKKQGISEAWARKFWIAHWDQPSIGQGFEMLHRGVIDKATLDLLFRAVEIPSFWRDKLTRIAYNPYTRVDTRRMHELGVLNEEELVKAYMDQGYDSEKAVKMAQFTIQYNAEHEKQLTRSAILESYRENLITRVQAAALLREQDYSDDLANYYIELEDFNRDKKIREQYIDNTRERYLLSQMTLSQARTTLTQLGLRTDTIDSLIDTWELDKYKYDSIPSKSDLDRFLIKGIISEGEYRMYMARHGFSALITDWYLRDLQGERDVRGRGPSRSDLEEFYKKKIIDEASWRREMKSLGYNDKYIDMYYKAI
jgi:hypothetical protein